MNDEPRARTNGQRRRTTRRLLRHPTRLTAGFNNAGAAYGTAHAAPLAPEPVREDITETDVEIEVMPGEGVEVAAESKLETESNEPEVTVTTSDDEEPQVSEDSEANDLPSLLHALDDTTVVDSEPVTGDFRRPRAREQEGAELSAALQPALLPDLAQHELESELALAASESLERAFADHDRALVRRDESEVQTKPKIRLSDSVQRRPSAPADQDAQPKLADADAVATSAPPSSSSNGNGHARSSLPPARPDSSPVPGGARLTPTGEGIVRSSLLPPSLTDRTDGAVRKPVPARDSDLPTRPRIPLTQDMALAAGRITSQEVAPYDDGSTRPRLAYQSNSQPGEPPPAVLVSRAHVISDTPPGSSDAAAAVSADTAALQRLARRRPESEEFETLDLDDSDAMSRLELASVDAAATAATVELGVRVSRTPPPPPATPTGRRVTAPALPPMAAPALPPVSALARPGPPPPPPPPTASAKKLTTTTTHKIRSKKRSWWEVLFSDDYVRTLPRPSPTAVAKQVSFMESSLGIKRGDAVLDVGCGLGQHALEFARRGYLVVALDLALSMITRAAEEAQQRGLRINFLHKDIRDIGFEGTFDAIVCVGTTFGFFDDEQNRGVISRLAHALKPGGRLLLEVVNRDFVIGSQPNLVWFEGDGCVVMEESDFNFYSSRLTVKRTMMRDDGRQSDIEYNIRLYSVHELGQLLKQAGFSIKEVSGQEATRGLFFGAQSTRIIILAERKARPRKQGDTGMPPPEQS